MMLEIRERINYVVLDKEQEKAYTSDSEAMLLLTPLCLERNVDKIGEMILKNNQDKLLDMESVFETSGQTV